MPPTAQHVFRTLAGHTVPEPLTESPPPAPDLHARVRAAASRHGHRPVIEPVVGPRRLVAPFNDIAPAPDLHARVRAAASARASVGVVRQMVSAPTPGPHVHRTVPFNDIAPAPDLHARVRAAAARRLAS